MIVIEGLVGDGFLFFFLRVGIFVEGVEGSLEPSGRVVATALGLFFLPADGVTHVEDLAQVDRTG